MNNRVLLRKKELLPIFIVLLLALAAVAVFSHSDSAMEAIVEQNGIVVAIVPLTAEKELEFSGDYPLTLAFSPTGVSVKSAACKDKTCMRTGKISRSGEAIVCLPARISVRLKGGMGYDSVTY